MAKMGRPTKYSQEIVELTYQYIDKCKKTGVQLPTLCGLSISLNVNKDTLVEWSKDKNKKDFSVAAKYLTSSQEEMLLQKGLSSEFNASITKLVLHNHGYRDKQDIETTEKPYDGVSDADLARRVRSLMDEIGDETPA